MKNKLINSKTLRLLIIFSSVQIIFLFEYFSLNIIKWNYLENINEVFKVYCLLSISNLNDEWHFAKEVFNFTKFTIWKIYK